ncbi:MAG: hypothetical protein J6B74_00235 [Ruminococcus sp.]|nr:hypothetical protein [Ruminococcus sp.]
MGFFDVLNSVNDYIGEEIPKKYAAIFRQASDYKLQQWWDENKYNYDVDQRIKDVAEKELRRRGLNY